MSIWDRIISGFALSAHSPRHFGDKVARIKLLKQGWSRSTAIAASSLLLLIPVFISRGVRASSNKVENRVSIQKQLRDLSTCCPIEEFKPFVGQPAATKAIEAMLTDQDDDAHWSKAILALGVIAPYNDETVDGLWNFLSSDATFAGCFKSGRRGQSGVSASSFQGTSLIEDKLARAKIEVPVAIGSLLARSTRPTVEVRKLIAGSDPQYWNGKIRWSGQSLFGSNEERNLFLASQCVRGLSFSGQAEAKEYIVGALHTHPPSMDESFLDSVRTAYDIVSKR